jgi:hypothetical protein
LLGENAGLTDKWPLAFLLQGEGIGHGAKGQSNPLGILPAADGKESDAPNWAFFPKVHFA